MDEAVGIFQRCSQTATGRDENLGILMPFHHAIEMLDGVEVLLDNSCVVASRTALRSALEASWALRYVLADEDYIEQRSLSYVVGDTYEWIYWYEEHDPKSNRGKQFFADMDLGEGSDFPMPDPADAEALKKMLAREPFASISAEYERVSGQTSGRVKWYSLFGGPRSIKDLARQLGELDNYLIVYRSLSKTVHAADLSRQLTKTDDGAASAVTVIRSPIGISDTYVWSINIGTEVSKEVLKHYRKGELHQFAKWYLEEVSPIADKLSRIEEE